MALDPLSLAVGVVGAGTNLFSQMNANKVNQKINEANLQYQREAAEKQMQFQREERLAAQEYNSPSNQANLFRQAGLNPLAMMEHGNSFAPTSAQSGSGLGVPSMIPYQAPQLDTGALMNSLNSMYDNKIKREQAEALKYQNDNKELTYQMQILNLYEDIANKRVKTKQDYEQLELLRSALRVAQKTEKYRISQNRSDAQAAQAQADLVDSQAFDHIVQRSLRYAVAESGYRISRKQEAELINKIGLLRQQIVTEGMTQRQISKNIDKIGAEILGIKTDALLKGQEYQINLPRELQSTTEADTYRGSSNYRAVKFGLKLLDDFKKSLLPEIAPISINK